MDRRLPTAVLQLQLGLVSPKQLRPPPRDQPLVQTGVKHSLEVRVPGADGIDSEPVRNEELNLKLPAAEAGGDSVSAIGVSAVDPAELPAAKIFKAQDE